MIERDVYILCYDDREGGREDVRVGQHGFGDGIRRFEDGYGSRGSRRK
jgi:hypothetical protein